MIEATMMNESEAETTEKIEEAVNEKKYELRELQSKDVFPMVRIIKKIGIKQFKMCFESEEAKAMIKQMMDKAEEEGESLDIESIGISIMLDIADVIIGNIPDAEQEIYQLLSQLSGMSKKEIETLDMVTFFEMIVDVFKKDEFVDFIQVVLKLFK